MKGKRLYISFFCVTVLCFAAGAHEFWLQPGKYIYEVGETAVISFKVGENFNGEPWDLKRHRVVRVEAHHGSAVVDERGGNAFDRYAKQHSVYQTRRGDVQ